MEPIALTDDDVARIANQLPGTFSAGLDGPDITCGPRLKRAIVRAVVKAINAADPVGTVRRSGGGNGIAVRITRNGEPQWRVVHVDDEYVDDLDYQYSAESISYWPVIIESGERS